MEKNGEITVKKISQAKTLSKYVFWLSLFSLVVMPYGVSCAEDGDQLSIVEQSILDKYGFFDGTPDQKLGGPNPIIRQDCTALFCYDENGALEGCMIYYPSGAPVCIDIDDIEFVLNGEAYCKAYQCTNETQATACSLPCKEPKPWDII